jgi:LCP family protein required for cell wall assembly
MRILGWTSIGLAVVLVATTLGAYITLRLKLDGITHVRRIDVNNRPKRYNSALNLLLLGSDTRHGRNAGVGGTGCNCSDTIMVVHISPGRGKVTVLSMPRDTMVPQYKCAPWDGQAGQPEDPQLYERINSTLANGGPECVRHTVEQVTGIYISDFVQLTFTGFRKVINDIGGVNVCVPFAVNDPIVNLGYGQGHGTGLKLSPGRHHINGKVALEFWRARYALADGTDTARIARDQYLMAQLAKGVLHSGLMSSPAKLLRVIGDVAQAMTTDASTSDLVAIVTSLTSVTAGHVQFVTAPTGPWPYDNNELELAQPQASAMFSAIAHDTRLPKAAGKKHGAGGQVLTISPARVKVMVLNGSGIGRQASRAAAQLTDRGFVIVGTGNATRADYVKSVIEYGTAADRPAANTLAEQFSSARIKLVPALAAGLVQVILGSDFTGLATPGPTASPTLTPAASASPEASPGATPSPSPTSIGSLSGSFGGITGTVSCRNSAFYGPNSPAPAGPVPCGC